MFDDDIYSIGWSGLGNADMDSDFLETEAQYEGYGPNPRPECGRCFRKLRMIERKHNDFLYGKICDECHKEAEGY